MPKSGSIQRVTVYPSDYGLQRMAEEAVAGPQGVWKANASKVKEQVKILFQMAAMLPQVAARRGYYGTSIAAHNLQ